MSTPVSLPLLSDSDGRAQCLLLHPERDSPAHENATYHLLIRHLDRFGGFPPLLGDRWHPKLSLEHLLATLHLEFNVEPLFELKVAADDMNNTQHIILVRRRLVAFEGRCGLSCL